MSYWWVNHKQTFKTEIKDGYIWSPQKNNNGSVNQSYLNLTKVKPHDLIYSYGKGYILAIGIVEAVAVDKARPAEFGRIGSQWSADGWLVPVRWYLLPVPIKPRDRIDLIAPLLPRKYSPIKPDGNGNQGVYLAGLSDELGALLLSLIKDANSEIKYAVADQDDELRDNEEEEEIASKNIQSTYKEQLIKARVGQGRFRMEVELIEKCCRLTQINRKEFLIASHIKPWKDSNDEEKLDGHNGFLLSPHVDKLFDNGYISFSNKGDILLVNKDVGTIMKQWGLDPTNNVGNFTKRQMKFLEFHRDEIFEKRKNF